MLREVEDLRNLAIGSPVPTPRDDDDDDGMFAEAFDSDRSFPAIRIDRCTAAVDTDAEDRSSKWPSDRSRNGRPPPRDEAATSEDGVEPRYAASNHAKLGKRCD